MENDDTIAVVADVHGNRWALEAVLEDIESRDVRDVLNLGDSLYGPLDPAGTADLLRRVTSVHVRGNQDRAILEADATGDDSPTSRFVLERLTDEHLAWLGEHRPAPVHVGSLCLCHGTPRRDDRYLAERVTESGVEIRGAGKIARELSDIESEVVLCAHSHVPRLLGLGDGRWLVNPGSVGLPAYEGDGPHPHAMEAGSPHARYAVLERGEAGWRFEHVAVAYDWEAAATVAERHDRADWAAWLRSGRATPGEFAP